MGSFELEEVIGSKTFRISKHPNNASIFIECAAGNGKFYPYMNVCVAGNKLTNKAFMSVYGRYSVNLSQLTWVMSKITELLNNEE